MIVMIDTCSWIDILNAEDDQTLSNLEYWLKSNSIKLLSNNVIIEEWNKGKNEEVEKLSRELKNKNKIIEEFFQKEKLSYPRKKEPNKEIEIYQNNLKQIDRILSSAKLIKCGVHVEAIAFRKLREGKAPFHINKIKSTDDALIIFSLLNFCKKNKIREFCFISANTTDFTDKIKDKNTLHPQLFEDYPGINPIYYHHIRQFVDNYTTHFPLPTEKIVHASNKHTLIFHLYEEISEDNPIDSQINMLYNNVVEMYGHIDFVPLPILKNIHPLKLKKSYYSRYSLTTDNQELFNFFQQLRDASIKKPDDYEIQNLEEKVNYIIKQLNNNLILFLTSSKTFENIDITVAATESKDNLKNSFLNCEFSKVLDIISVHNDSLNEKITSAYYYYRLGFFVEAERLFKEASEIALNEKKYIQFFIAQFNRKELANHILFNYSEDVILSQVIPELEKINLIDALNSGFTDFDKEVIDWINNLEFINNCRRDLMITRDRIRDQYYLIESGGWSSGNHYWSLINQFSQLYYFIEKNRVVFEFFEEFNEIIDVFTEAIICLQAMPESELGDGNHGLDDWSLNIILHYAKADRIEKYIKRYNLSILKYRSIDNNTSSFLEKINNFLTSVEITKSSLEKHSNLANRFFWDRYNHYFQNLILMAAYLDLPEEHSKKISTKLLDFLKQEDVIRAHYIEKYLPYFLNRKAKSFSAPIAKQYLTYFYRTPKFHNTTIIEDTIRIINKNYEMIILSDEEFSTLLYFGIEECNKCKSKHEPGYLIFLHKTIKKKKQKESIEKGLSLLLEEKYNLDLHYAAVIHDVLPFDDKIIERMIIQDGNNMPVLDVKSVFSKSKEKRYAELNMLANYCYKFQVDTSDSKFDIIRSINTYYEWLFGMRDFDYSNFNPLWVLEYETKYFLNEFRKHQVIKEKVCEYIKVTRNKNLEKAYINIYGCN